MKPGYLTRWAPTALFFIAALPGVLLGPACPAASVQMTLTASPNPSAVGSNVVLTATITGWSGTPPTGQVFFLDSSTLVGANITLNTAPVNSHGVAVLAYNKLVVGGHGLTALYSGDANYDPTVTSSLAFNVNPLSPWVAVTSSKNPSTPGQSVTLTATTTGFLLSPFGSQGTVNFMDGTTSLGTATAVNGVARLTTSSLAAGTHAVTALYQGSTGSAATSFPFSQAVASYLIMPMGDSITVGGEPTVGPAPNNPAHGGYRAFLWALTGAAGWSVQYVGSVADGPPGIGACEAHSGWQIPWLTNIMPTMLPLYQPKVILLQMGNNDFGRYHLTSSVVLANMGKLLDKISSVSPNTLVYAASLTPLDPLLFPATNHDVQNINAFNQALPGLVQQHAALGQNVQFVDMHNLCGFTEGDWTADGTHPSPSGYAKMANVWYNQLQTLPIPKGL